MSDTRLKSGRIWHYRPAVGEREKEKERENKKGVKR